MAAVSLLSQRRFLDRHGLSAAHFHISHLGAHAPTYICTCMYTYTFICTDTYIHIRTSRSHAHTCTCQSSAYTQLYAGSDRQIAYRDITTGTVTRNRIVRFVLRRTVWGILGDVQQHVAGPGPRRRSLLEHRWASGSHIVSTEYPGYRKRSTYGG